MKFTRQVALFCLILPPCVVLPLGCGSASSNPGKLSGSVTLDGAPVTGGDLFIYSKPGPVHATISATGSYTSTDLPVGEWKVTVSTESLNPTQKKIPDTYEKKGGVSPGPKGKGAAVAKDPGTYVAIPKLYQDEKTTTLSVNVTAGSQTKNFELTSK